MCESSRSGRQSAKFESVFDQDATYRPGELQGAFLGAPDAVGKARRACAGQRAASRAAFQRFGVSSAARLIGCEPARSSTSLR
jgi:hypothetical protein